MCEGCFGYMYVCVPHVCMVTEEARRESIRSPGLSVADWSPGRMASVFTLECLPPEGLGWLFLK